MCSTTSRRMALRAFLLRDGQITYLDPPGSIVSQAGFVNSRGDVVGGYRDSTSKRHAFLWSRGTFTTIDPPNGHPTLGPVAFGINDRGQVVGTFVDASGARHGFLRSSKGTYTTLDYPGALLTVAESIDAQGRIAGIYVDADGNQHGFLFAEDSQPRLPSVLRPGCTTSHPAGAASFAQWTGGPAPFESRAFEAAGC